MKWRGAPVGNNVEDRRGGRAFVYETDRTRGDRQFNRVRQARLEASLKRKPLDSRAAIQAAHPETADMPSRAAATVERMIGRINAQPTTPDPGPDPRRPNSRPVGDRSRRGY